MATKASAAVGSAAGKKRQAVLDISIQIEDSIKNALAALAINEKALPAATSQHIPPASSAAAASTAAIHLTHQISEVYKSLTNQGFRVHDVERALQALPLHSIAFGSTLDWLLLHLDHGDLPKQYADQVQVFGEVELRHAASKPGSKAANRAQEDDQKAIAAAAAAAAAAEKKRREEAEKEAAAKAEAEKRKEEQEKAARRAWILQYAEESSSDDDSSFDSENDSEKSHADSVIEDWEIWGDPREVERRRAERARAALSMEDRLELIASELARTMQGAAKAKSEGNREEQRMYGQMIGQLKKEMAELGVSEVDLPKPGEGGGQKNNNEAIPAGGDDDDETKSPGSYGSISGDSTSGSSRSGSDSEDSDVFDPGFDIFDGGAVDQIENVPGQDADRRSRRRAKAMAAAALQPWGVDGSGASGKGKKGGKNAPGDGKKALVQVVQPKAALQQACQRQGWGAPRYERSSPGGGRDAAEGGGDCRYSVTIDPGTNAGSKKKAGKERNRLVSKRTFVVPEEDDGWAKIEDAQNAAATLALMVLCSEEDPELWKQLPGPFNELFLAWQEEGVGLEQLEESEEAIAAREEFVKSLVADKLREEGAEEQALSEEAREEEEHMAWAESLKRRLAQRQKDTRAAAEESASSERLLKQLVSFRNSGEGAKWQKARAALPAASLREELRDSLAKHDVIVVSGETGSGKTTQIPQFILEHETEAGKGGACSIVCTQPRRIAAISVAERVASERGEPAPGERGAAVGYAVRLDSATTADTRLLFCTTGILLRRLASDPALASVSHVVVDEVHERTLQGDFLIALLRDLVAHRRAAGVPLKVVLMSATLDSELLAAYFGGCPMLHAPGRTYPVEHLFLEDAMETTGYVLAPDAPAALRPGGARRERQRRLENAAGARNKAALRAGWGDDEGDEILNPYFDEEIYSDYSISVQRNMARVDEDRIDFDLLEDLVGYIHDNEAEGAILVFLPGMAEISNLHRRLEASRKFAGCWVVPLHSTVAPADQRKAFRKPPKGTRKIVIATNIAETSLTIEDVVYVIDSGKLKERRHDASRSMSLLVEDWVSVASAKQRKGRAGRVREGVCYAMYTRDRFERRMRQYQTPEMARVPLEELILQVHLLRVAASAAAFTARVLQPPPAKAVDGALRVLREVGALTEAESLTPLGHYLAQLPVDARVGKLLLLASSLGCLAPALTIAACLSHKTPFATGLAAADGAERARAAFAAPESVTIAAGQQSDHLIMAAAVDGWLAAKRKGGTRAGSEFARKHCLTEQTLDMLEDMRGQFAAMLADIGFLSSEGAHTRGRAWYDDYSLRANQYARHPAVLKGVLLAALYPNVAVMDDTEAGPGRKPSWHDGTGNVTIHPGSICAEVPAARFQRPFLTYLEKVRTSQVFLRDCTVASPAALLLFGGKLEVDHAAGRVTIDGWLRVRAAAKTAALIGKLRQALEAILRRKVAAPRKDIGDSGGAAVIAAIVELLNYEEVSQNWDK